MGLAEEIASAGLTQSMRRIFARALRVVAGADGTVDAAEMRSIQALMGGDLAGEAPREPIEAVWPHAELLVRACIHVALVDGSYGVEKARAVSLVAHRLGVSSRRLARLERQVFDQLKASLRRPRWRPDRKQP